MRSFFLCSLLMSVWAVPALQADKLVIKGSDTLGAKWVPMLAEAFKAQNPDTSFEIAAEGSTTGIAAITDGTCEIGMSSRKAKSTEVSAAKAKGVDMHETVVCYDALGIIVNANNPIQSLTKRQVEQIFTGDITSWVDVGGTAGTISLYTRNTASGTYQDFKDLAMSKRDYAPSSQKMAGHEQIAAEVGKNASGIGYVGIAYFGATGIKVIPVEVGGQKIMPSRATVLDKTYPYFRPNYFYTKGAPSGLAAKFIAFIFTTEGHKITEQVHFVPGDSPFTTHAKAE